MLGPVRVLGPSGDPIKVPRGKLTQLLQLLAFSENGISRERLIAALWPDATDASGARSLRQAFSSIRGLVGSDPFADTTWVTLDKNLCQSDSWALDHCFSSEDYSGCLALVRGPLQAGKPLASSSDVMWQEWEAWYQTAIEQVRIAAAREVSSAQQRDDEVGVTNALAQAELAGISALAIRKLLDGDQIQSAAWANTRVGLSAVEAIVFRARRGLPSSFVRLLESESGWGLESLRAVKDALPSFTRPAVLTLADSRPLAHLLTDLIDLPGGAGIRPATRQTLLRLDTDAEVMWQTGEGQSEVILALADSLEAVLDEQALIIVGTANDLPQQLSTVLSRAIAQMGGDGLTVVIVGTEERDFLTPPVATLRGACPHEAHILQDFPTHERNISEGGHRPPSATPTRGRPERLLRPRTWAEMALSVTLIALITVQFLDRQPTATKLGQDIVFCSDRGGPPQYYRWGLDLGVERISADTAISQVVTCKGHVVLAANGDSLYLPVLSGGQEQWRSYPNSRVRSNLTGDILPFPVQPQSTAMLGSETYVVIDAQVDEMTLLDALTKDTIRVVLPPGQALADVLDSEVLVRSQDTNGILTISMISQDSRSSVFSTGSTVDETDGWFLMDGSFILSRGKTREEEDGSLDLVIIDPRTGSEEWLTQNDWNDYEISLSRDRKYGCWQSERFGHYESDIMLVDLSTRETLPLADERGRQNGCRFSDDGSFVAYQSMASGDLELMARSIDGGPPVRITTFPGRETLMGFLPIR